MSDTFVRLDAIRIPRHRAEHGSCLELAKSIRDDGLRRPVTLWRDNTVISGERRVFAHLLFKIDRVQVVYVSTIEEAAKALLGDNQDTVLALPPKWSEVCRLWQTLRRLDEPAAVRRADENRRRGVELRRQTQAGKRPAGRSHHRTEDYVLSVICEPFGVSAATAARVEQVFRAATGLAEVDDEKRALARTVLAEFDDGEPVWPGYERFRGARSPMISRPKPVVPAAPAPAAQQRAAWTRSLPQLEGLVNGLIELGPPSPDLTWAEVGPVRTRLMAVRREIEKMINQMKETSQS
jgi:hypothetical protein